MRIKFWGVRGSIPVPGNGTIRYGGNTCCVEIEHNGSIVILDSGTGIRELGLDLVRRGVGKKGGLSKLNIFFSHVHWDHIQGFPFFKPAFIPEVEINLYGHKHSDIDIENALRGQMVAPHFPIVLRDMPSRINFIEVKRGETLRVDGLVVDNIELNHPNGALGYRITNNGKSVVYLCDHEHVGAFENKIIEFVRGTNVLIFDAQYTPDEYSGANGKGGRVGWGHSTWKMGVDLSRSANVELLVLFHHGREDQGVSEIETLARKEYSNTIAAFEGLEIKL
jgi:phosphoribosyl 1,2-cyclic phosphodiesterase